MIQLGRHKFVVPEPDGMRTFAFQQRIIPIAGRVANVFLSLLGIDDVSKLADMDVASVLPIAVPHIGAIFSEMPAGELEALTRELLRDAKFGENEPTLALFGSPGGDAFGSLMRGRAVDGWKLLWHALGVWYPDFFALVRGFTAGNGARVTPSTASTTSPGAGQVSA